MDNRRFFLRREKPRDIPLTGIGPGIGPSARQQAEDRLIELHRQRTGDTVSHADWEPTGIGGIASLSDDY